MYMEVSEWKDPIFALSKNKQIWSEDVVNVQIVRITNSAYIL